MLITTTRRHLCLIFLKTAGAILLFQVARANWPATRTKLTANTFQVKISKYKLKISLTRPTMKEEEKSARAEAFSSLLELQHGMSCRNRMSYIHDPAEKQYLQRPRNLNVLWDIWDIWWLRTECLTMVARKYSQYWIGIRQNHIKSNRPILLG